MKKKLDIYRALWVHFCIMPGLYIQSFFTINELGLAQEKSTETTRMKARKLLDCVYIHKFATLRYKSSDMCLHIDSNAAYLVASGTKSRITGYYYLSNN